VVWKYRQREPAASCSGNGPVAGSFEHGKEASDATEGRLVSWLREWNQLINEESADRC